MADDTVTAPDATKSAEALQQIPELPESVQEWAKTVAQSGKRSRLEDVFRGSQYDTLRHDLRANGFAMYRDDSGVDRMIGADVDENGYVTAVAAAIPRSPGKSFDWLSLVDDFQVTAGSNEQQRISTLKLYNSIYRAEGIVNNAINKLASLVAADGAFKVRSVKGQRGKSGDKKGEEFQTLLNWWRDNVNARGQDQVITGDRGLQSFLTRGARMCMIEGDHIARHWWPKKAAVVPNLGNYTMPMNMQTFSAQYIHIPPGLDGAGTNYEIMYWKPPSKFVQLLNGNTGDKNVDKVMKQLIPSDVVKQLQGTQMYFLDPSLLIHVKNRGTGVDIFGESAVEPAMASVRYKRALDALELTVITNLLARMVIVKVGSDNEKSVYHRQEVSNARLSLLQRMMRNVGPAATILWAGPDISVVEVSAHDALPDLVARYNLAERRIVMDLGVPMSILIGEGNDKMSAYASALTLAGQLKEIQNQYAQALRSIAELIAEENGFQEVDVVWEWTNNILDDKQAAANLILQMFQVGLASTQTATEELGLDYGAEVARQEADVAAGYKTQAFGPPLAAQTTNPMGVGGESGGRPPRQEKPGQQDPRTGKEQVQHQAETGGTPGSTPGGTQSH